MNDFNAIDDFIDDTSFRNWVLRNDAESGLSWNKWLTENPEKLEVFNEAKAVLLELDLPGNDWNAEKERVLHQKIQQRINKKTIPLHPKQKKSNDYAIHRYGAKAAVITFF